jgi:predicted SprT family Zn-dependent metalloprotease
MSSLVGGDEESLGALFAAASARYGWTWEAYQELLSTHGHLLESESAEEVVSPLPVFSSPCAAAANEVDGTPATAVSSPSTPSLPAPLVDAVTVRKKGLGTAARLSIGSAISPLHAAAADVVVAVAVPPTPSALRRWGAIVDDDDDDDEDEGGATAPAPAPAPVADLAGEDEDEDGPVLPGRRGPPAPLAAPVQVAADDVEEGEGEVSLADLVRSTRKTAVAEEEVVADEGDEEEAEEEAGDEDQYDFDDGFLVDEDEEDEEDEGEGASDDDEEDAYSDEEDSDGSSDIEYEENATPAASAYPTPSRAGLIPHARPPPLPPSGAATPSGKGGTRPPTVPPRTAATPRGSSGLVGAAAAAASSTPTGRPPQSQSQPQRRCGCKSHGGAALSLCPSVRALQDGDTDPHTGRVFIREENDKQAASAAASASSSSSSSGAGGPLGSAFKVRPSHSHSHASSAGSPTRSLLLALHSGSGADERPSVPASPSSSSPPNRRYAFRNKKHRDALTASLYSEYNRVVFDSRLPADLPLKWDARLRTTAGTTTFGREETRIALSIKVLDTPFRLAQTLLHEMCHAAQWLLDGVKRPPHGAAFMAWARRASRAYPARAVAVCHNYEIRYKFTYACGLCAATYGRFSKSIGEADRCSRPLCGGRLVLLDQATVKGAPGSAAAVVARVAAAAAVAAAAGGGGGGGPSTPGGLLLSPSAAPSKTPSAYQ